MNDFIHIFSEEGQIEESATLSSYTTWRVGGIAAIIFSPFTVEALQRAIQYAITHGVEYKIFGKGSNILASDKPYNGLIISLGKIKDKIERQSETRFTIGAGMGLPQVSRYLAKNGYTGHEFFSGIPGSIGGAIVMNAGTPKGEIKDVLVQAVILNEHGEIERWSNKDLAYQYRHSVLKKRPNAVVVAGDFYFTKETVAGSSLEKIKTEKTARLLKQPLNYPNCGSVFQNPTGNFAGNLIESAGIKGYQVGGAMVSTMHANFILNTGEATAQDIADVIAYVQQKVFETSGIQLKTEVEYFNW